MKDREDTAELQAILGDVASRSRRYFLPHRKIFLLWGAIQIAAGGGSQLLLVNGMSRWIAGLWLSLVAFGVVMSRSISHRLQATSGVKPALLGYFVPLWLGGTGVIISFFLLSVFVDAFSIKYLIALSFPVLALCILVSATLFQSRTLYTMAAVFLLAMLPAALFTEYALLIQASVLGGGLILLGVKRDV